MAKSSSKTGSGSKGGQRPKVGQQKRSAKKVAAASSDEPVSPPKRSWFRRLFRWVAVLLVVIVAYPFVFTLLYKVEVIRPISHLMIREALVGNGMTRKWVEFEDIAPVLVQSVMMSEDGQYCAHSGVDWDALNTVIEDAIDGERTRGASTISMQTAKNLFLWNDRSYLRKALEIPLALWLDLVLGKKRLMEIYLNIAEWDKGVFGAQAAAKHYFGRDVARLTRRQAALLTVTLPNPKARNAARPNRSMNRVAGIVEQRARQSGAYIKCLY